MKIRGTGYGKREITYEQESRGKWIPISKEAIQRLLKDGVVIHMNARGSEERNTE
jgi:hypothetical protein